mmetsp:Transcript_8823/g.19601  ORF Transcript_8823/g.19601 Transcript_8823/m.19601 type:complete len:278 (-) Transcript_8823:85-918(-)
MQSAKPSHSCTSAKWVTWPGKGKGKDVQRLIEEKRSEEYGMRAAKASQDKRAMMMSCEPFLLSFWATSRGVFFAEFGVVLLAPQRSKAFTMSSSFSWTATWSGMQELVIIFFLGASRLLKPLALRKASTFFSAAASSSFAFASTAFRCSSAASRARRSASAFSRCSRSSRSLRSAASATSLARWASSASRMRWRRASAWRSSSSFAFFSASRRALSCCSSKDLCCSCASVARCVSVAAALAVLIFPGPVTSASANRVGLTFTVSVVGSEWPQALHAL